ncbi:hypothetical protein GTCCBUS3UF5_2260 [Geobacillus thermoleovorans CCB_US3_UF5]|uniref:Transposase n=1 Tax=Geobacillus thermoleovorans CCB_US3_UF5 TaxID=1111068 RepID=A0ABN3ZP89_GEOTH|nr:hypothetical protein GTCCBUS3UF5_2260 [Geobacillus thermoleovorans CCB_US3_UF5]
MAMPFIHFIMQKECYDENGLEYPNKLVFGIFFLCIIHNYKEAIM